MIHVQGIRQLLAEKYVNKEINDDGTVELIGQSFVADEDSIFGKVSDDYVRRELDWYLSQSLYVEDIEGETPKIWKAHASRTGKINSNYGYLTLHHENHDQYNNALSALLDNKLSRHGIMIYTRPSMHKDWMRDGMSDFVCTNAVQYFIRDNKLNTVVQMRSNDVVFGYKNDFAWQTYIRNSMFNDLSRFYPELEIGEIVWNAASLHVYPRHHYLIDEWLDSNEK